MPAPSSALLKSSAEDFSLREWQGEAVVFDRRSGETHQLNLLATALLTTAGHQAWAPEALVDAALLKLEVGTDPELREAGTAALAALVQQGLLHTADA